MLSVWHVAKKSHLGIPKTLHLPTGKSSDGPLLLTNQNVFVMNVIMGNQKKNKNGKSKSPLLNIIYMGKNFYKESGSAMSSIYDPKTLARLDWAWISRCLKNGWKVHIRLVTDKEMKWANAELKNFKLPRQYLPSFKNCREKPDICGSPQTEQPMNTPDPLVVMKTCEIDTQIKRISSRTTYAYRPRNKKEKDRILEGNVPQALTVFLMTIGQYNDNHLRWIGGDDPFIAFDIVTS